MAKTRRFFGPWVQDPGAIGPRVGPTKLQNDDWLVVKSLVGKDFHRDFHG